MRRVAGIAPHESAEREKRPTEKAIPALWAGNREGVHVIFQWIALLLSVIEVGYIFICAVSDEEISGLLVSLLSSSTILFVALHFSGT